MHIIRFGETNTPNSEDWEHIRLHSIRAHFQAVRGIRGTPFCTAFHIDEAKPFPEFEYGRIENRDRSEFCL